MTNKSFPDEFLTLLDSVKGKRARIVVNHILENGFITTEELEQQYGYNHPPRAVRDVREQGVPIETFKVRNNQGRSIAAYQFGDPSQATTGKQGGRRIFPKSLKVALLKLQNGKCAICLEEFEERYLQIDHRIPYQVAGEPKNPDDLENYMLLCGSCNRAKSWSCENCNNAILHKNPGACQSCYWGDPLKYDHIALRPLRRASLTWSGKEVEEYESLRQLSESKGKNLPEYVKNVLRKHLRAKRDNHNETGAD